MPARVGWELDMGWVRGLRLARAGESAGPSRGELRREPGPMLCPTAVRGLAGSLRPAAGPNERGRLRPRRRHLAGARPLPRHAPVGLSRLRREHGHLMDVTGASSREPSVTDAGRHDDGRLKWNRWPASGWPVSPMTVSPLLPAYVVIGVPGFITAAQGKERRGEMHSARNTR